MRRTGDRVVALLTDFGTRDWYVAALKGVILARAPHARLVDVTHEVPPQDVLAGAFTLAAAAPWFPRGTIFVAVVDPGVGTNRALLAVQAHGRYFLGPDNGLLALSLEAMPPRTVVRLTNPRYWLRSVSHTFHGRDILAPVAAYLARGGSLHRLGSTGHRINPLTLPLVQRRARGIVGAIVHIDAFGNLITNLRADQWLPAHRRQPVRLRYRRHLAPVVSSYASGRLGQLIAVAGSLGFIELAIRDGSAARVLGACRGESIRLNT
ncbi:MAG: SAM-dependent chlorinase/fluorinase [Candidatus Omnitrophica bacterium]|nr:SAM-dependent chlorinase/fluorinase [Candidatus Omnitrophota bacterium]